MTIKYPLRSLLLCILLLSSFGRSSAQPSLEVRECMGSLSAVMLYNTYLTIGSIADMHTSGTIKKDFALELCSEQIGMLDAVRQAVQKVIDDNSKGALTGDDKAYVKELSVTLGQLKNQVSFLEKYIKGANESDAKEYHKYREAAWGQIADLLGLDE